MSGLSRVANPYSQFSIIILQKKNGLKGGDSEIAASCIIYPLKLVQELTLNSP